MENNETTILLTVERARMLARAFPEFAVAIREGTSELGQVYWQGKVTGFHVTFHVSEKDVLS